MKSFLKFIVVGVLTLEARLALFLRKPIIVAVTGNVGKTSTKDAIATAISGSMSVRKSEKSFNSEIGIPLAILGLSNAWMSVPGWFTNILAGLFAVFMPSFPKVLVLEVGADKPDDIKKITKWLHPDVAVFTRLQTVPVHVENFGSPEKLFEEKGYLSMAIKEGGILVINTDDDKLERYTKILRKVIRYGFHSWSEVRGDKYFITYKPHSDVPTGIELEVADPNEKARVHIPNILGKHHSYPILAACAVADILAIPLSTALERLASHITPKGRMKPIELASGAILIDDSYNSSPIATEEALKVLGDIRATGRKFAVLGDMKELGGYSLAEHKRIGILAAQVARIVVGVGEEAKGICETAKDGDLQGANVLWFPDSKLAGDALSQMVKVGDVVLVKGSQSTRMERVCEALIGNREHSEKHLVRQEKAWKKR